MHDTIIYSYFICVNLLDNSINIINGYFFTFFFANSVMFSDS